MGFHAAAHLPEATKELTHQLAFFICLRRGDGLRLNAPDKHGPRRPDPAKARRGSHKHSPKDRIHLQPPSPSSATARLVRDHRLFVHAHA